MQTQMINFSIPNPLLIALDNQAKSEIKTRSEVLRDAIRLYIGRQQELTDIFAYGENRVKKLKLKPANIEAKVDEYRQGE